MQEQDTNAPEVSDEQAEVLDKAAEGLTEDDIREQEEESDSEAEKKFTQADLDRVVSERLEREKKQREKAATKAREEAEAKALEDQKEYQSLAEKRQEKIGELEAEVERLSGVVADVEPKAKKYQATLEKELEARMEGVPDYIKGLLEGRDPVDQLTWLTENHEQVTGPQDRPSGSRPSPNPSGPTTTQTDKEAKETERSRVSAAL